MRSRRTVAAAALVLAGVAGVADAAAPAVPAAAQARLVRTQPDLAAVPTRLPLRTVFVGWRFDAPSGRVIERFQDVRFPGDPRRALTLSVHRFGGVCAAGKARTLQMGGNRVYVDETGTTAWRCLTRPAVKVVATSGGALPDVGLGRVVASVRRVA